ncbi:MAG: Alkaline phosphatase synthesis transcriptional regulatory protein PhoP [Firmicutes bacterium]|nr:Alkaline phosphatase synthesis transcriptional regulatory protein PhoP [Bacillota bacterium]
MSRKILIVDDEENIRSGLSYALKRESYEVYTADNGLDALTLAREVNPDVILLDRMLPGLDGLEVCRQLRAQSDVPIIMVTAKDTEMDTVVGLEVGADDYITKPFSLNVLLARIKAVLRRKDVLAVPEGSADEGLGYGPFTLYPQKYVAYWGEKDLLLTPKLFDILHLLIRNPGRVFSRDELLEKVWGIDYAGETRTVDVHITWLRKRIEKDPSDPKVLLTVRGVGYKLAEHLHA